MVLSRIFQDEINASEARKRAISRRSGPTPIPRTNPVRVTPRDFIIQAVTQATQSARPGGSSGAQTPVPGVPAPTPSATPPASRRSSGSTGRTSESAKSRADVRNTKTVSPKRPRLNLDEISAALDAISAMFDLQKGELTAEQASAKQAFDFLKSSLFRARDEAVEQTRDVAAGRGILRSGLYLNRAAEIGDEAATQVAQAQSQRDARIRAITSRAQSIAAQEAAQRRARATELARQQVGYNEDIAAALELV